MEQLSGLDAMFVQAELHGLPMHISSFSIYDPSTAPGGKVEFRHVLDIFEKKIQHEVPILRSRLVEVPLQMDLPYWVEDPHFDMVYHVRHIALPRPGDWDKLFTLIANLHAQPLNRARPLWEAYVIDGLDRLDGVPKGSFGLFLKVHHSIMDGRTGMAIYSNLHTISPEQQPLDKKKRDTSPAVRPVAAVEEEPSLGTLVANASSNNVRKTLGLGSTLLKIAKTVGRLGLGVRSGELHSLEKVKIRFNGAVSPGRVVDRQRLPIQDIRVIREACPGATVNDVALAIISGGLRRYLADKDELPEQSLVSGVPIDVRTPQDTHVRGNMVSIMNVSLRSDIADPLDRLRAVHEEAQASKRYAEAIGRTLVNEVLDGIYSGLTSWAIRSVVESGALAFFAPIHNTIVTNVPGAPIPLYLAGARMVDSFGMGPLIPNTGLFHTVSSTYECLNIAFVGCREMMPDPAFYSECIGEAFEELRDAALEARARRLESANVEERKAKRREKRVTRRVHASRAGSKTAAPVQKAARKHPLPETVTVDSTPATAPAADAAARPAGLTVVSDNTKAGSDAA